MNVYILKKPCIIPGIHHVAVLVRDPKTDAHRVFEHTSNVRIVKYMFLKPQQLTLMGRTPMTMEDIVAYEETLPKKYILGVRDCRHHASDILRFCLPIDELPLSAEEPDPDN